MVRLHAGHFDRSLPTQDYPLLLPLLHSTTLWLKATEIAIEKSLNIVDLGGLHTLMSFAGSIGSLMDGSGIEIALQTIYGESTVKHMLHEKAIARATRGHILVESALMMKLQQLLSNEKMADSFDKLTNEEMLEIELVCNQVSEKEITLCSVDSQALQKLQCSLVALREYLSSKSKTAKLWLQYMLK